MTDESYLYWCHLPEHVDVTSEGYVGVSKFPDIRLRFHKSIKASRTLKQMFIEHGNRVKHTLLCKGSRKYCMDLETTLRPIRNIGWNVSSGGGEAPCNKGAVLTEEHKRKIGISGKGKHIGQPSSMKGKHHSEATRKLIGSYHKGKIISEAHRRGITENNSGALHIGSIVTTLYHINQPHKVYKFDNLRIAAEELGINYSTLRSAHRLKRTTPNRAGWVIVYD